MLGNSNPDQSLGSFFSYGLAHLDTFETLPERQGPGQFAQVIYGCGKNAKF